MTATLILEALAKEFSVDPAAIQSVFEMTDAGLSAPFIGRFRRARTGALTENQVRRLLYRREGLEELERRKGTILRTLERQEIPAAGLEAIQRCTDRFEIEDLFVPYRRPEPEVQLAMDRGLGGLADQLVQSVPRSERRVKSDGEGDAEGAPAPESSEPKSDSVTADAPAAEAPAAEAPAAEAPAAEAPAAEAPAAEAPAAEAPAAEAPAAEAPAAEAPAAEAPAAEAPAAEAPAAEAPAAEAPAAEAPAAEAPAAEAPAAEAPTAEAPTAEASASEAAAPSEAPPAQAPSPKGKGGKSKPSAPEPQRTVAFDAAAVMTPELARICEPFVSPDKGVHTEAEALAGAVRILSDRLGRDANLRGLIRRMLRKRGTLRVKALVDPGKAGRHKGLLKLSTPLKGLQGHRLLSLRAAQKERVLGYAIELDPKVAVPKVRQALGKHTRQEVEPLLQEVARQAFHARLEPVVEADVRLELKERGDNEALRFLSQHLRQLMLTPPFGYRSVIGIDVNAKGDWTLAAVDPQGAITKLEKIEVGDKDDAALAKELAAFQEGTEAFLAAVGHGKGPRAGGKRLRAVAAAGSLDFVVTLVNEAGLSSYANSELARKELEGTTVPQRMAISIARRIQDPMAEFLKVDPRHLGLGAEQGQVSKANLRRVLADTVASTVAFVGCDLNRCPEIVLRNMPGLDQPAIDRLLEARREGRLTTREALRADGLLDEAQWVSAVAFLRLPDSSNPLDRTSLHPEQYDLAGRLLESAGGSAEDSLGRPGVTKGLKRVAFEVDESTWRDLMRELSFPGRDPRMRLRVPQLLPPDTEAARLTKDRVVEGVVSAVASFGAFVDLGLAGDAMVHISQISSRYVRDARELLSIGQTVRAKISDPSGQRMALTLKDVPAAERPARGGGGGGGGGRGKGGGRGPRQRDERAEFLKRGDARGMPLGDGKGRGRRGGPGGRDRDRRGKEESGGRVDLSKLNSNSKAGAYTPFADFFKKDKD